MRLSDNNILNPTKSNPNSIHELTELENLITFAPCNNETSNSQEATNGTKKDTYNGYKPPFILSAKAVKLSTHVCTT